MQIAHHDAVGVTIAERLLLAQEARKLRAAYRRKLPAEQLERYVCHFSEPGVLTAALNWYRALNTRKRLGKVFVATLFVWDTPGPGPGARRTGYSRRSGKRLSARYSGI